jgi:EpsI family protein
MEPDRLAEQGARAQVRWVIEGLLLAGMLVVVLVLYRETALYLGDIWSRYQDGAYGHGFLVLAVSGYLIYQRRKQIVLLAPCPDPNALPLVAVCMLAWLAAALVDIQLLQVVVLLPLILSIAWVMAGARVTRQLLFPVAFIALALPIWSPLQPVLREITAAGAFFLVRLFGIIAFLQDYTVELPSGKLSIEAACSGLNYLLAGLALSVFYAHQNYRRFQSRLLVVVTVAAAAVVANILRVFIIIYLASVTSMQHPLVQDHLTLGWYLFGALVLLLLITDHQIYRRSAVAGDVLPVPAATAGEAFCEQGKLQRVLLTGAVMLLAVTGPVVDWWVKHRMADIPDLSLELPQGRAGWNGPEMRDDSWMPVYHGAIGLRGVYSKNDTRVFLYVGIYTHQSQGSELINDENLVSDGRAWQATGIESNKVSSGGYPVIETEIASMGDRTRLVWYCYRIAGRYTSSRLEGKLLQLAGLLTGQQGAAVLALSTDYETDIALAHRELDDFLAAMEPALAQLVDGQPGQQGWYR